MLLSQVISQVLGMVQAIAIPETIKILVAISPVAFAAILYKIMWPLWLQYIRAKNFFSLKYVVLEIKLPKDTFKSPAAMEVVLNALHNTSDGNAYAQYWKGETRPWYSLEIISIEGQVKFMIWTEDRRKNGVMSALYSQIPGIEITEREDYARSVYFDPKEMKIWAEEFEFTKKDKEKDVFPIKTYVDYSLDKDPKEEFKVDPLTPLLEFLGNVGPDQQVWFQILAQAHKKQKKPGAIFKTTDIWEENSKEIVNKILMRDPETKVAGTRDEVTGFTKLPSISEGEKEAVAAIERKMTKHVFDVGIRAMYIAKKDLFDTPFGIGGIISSMKQFSSPHFNGFKPSSKWQGKLDSPWHDFRNFRRNILSRECLMAYKRRSYFYEPFKGEFLVMNSEELATIFHFPGAVAGTPTLERIPSKKAQAPMNLPV